MFSKHKIIIKRAIDKFSNARKRHACLDATIARCAWLNWALIDTTNNWQHLWDTWRHTVNHRDMRAS